MYKKLLKLSETQLRLIAKDYSIINGTKETIARELTDYLKAYGLRWTDLACRYELKD